ncbi:RHS repeat-associated core domain-containing protein [Yersinia aldovae]|uniref:RHS repeat-associated core domain-containing protein n=2 Tax=Yersinia aldovae TaxID=29483 RepID=UPI001643B791|nr:RHS repeat-associated core domain-containing protein [Yersinia aldovae]
MSIGQGVWTGAGAAGGRSAVRQEVMDQQRGASPPNTNEGGAESFNEQALNFMESEGVNNTVTAGMGAYAIATGAGAPFAVGLAAGYVGAKAGGYVGEKAGDAIAESLGWKKVATDGDAPARMGDFIAHQKKDLGSWGALGGILLGAVAAVAVGALVVATGGAALVVVAAAAAAGGFVGAGVAAAGAVMGQYGDNKGTILSGSPDVFFEGKPVARVGDPIICSDHPGAPPVIAEGAKTVYANGKQIARLGHRTTCDANINSGAATIAETKETAQVFAVKDSRSSALRWVTIVASYLPLPKGKKGEKPKKSVEAEGCSNNKCTKPGEPVDAATGDFLQVWPMIDIPGLLPLNLTRLYRSSGTLSGSFGAKWADNWSQHLIIEQDIIRFRNHEGVLLSYDAPQDDDDVQAVNLHEGQYLLYGQRSGVLHIFNRQTQQILSFAERQGDSRRLSAISDRFGNQIRFRYSVDQQLSRIEHSVGYALELSYQQQQLTLIELVTAAQRQWLVKCRYDENGLLAECDTFQFTHLYHTYNAAGHMTRWHDTDKTDAYIHYDQLGRVLSTRTASGHYQDRFIYDDVARCTTYQDAEGGFTRFWYNTDGQVIREVDPLGREHLTEWAFSNKLSETDALGRTLVFQRNPHSELQQVVTPAGDTYRYDYNGFGQITQSTLPDGKCWQFIYGDNGELCNVVDPQGRRQEYRYGEQGELVRQILPDGIEWRYRYNNQYQVSEIIAPDGGVTLLNQDIFGRILDTQDPLGQTTRSIYSPQHASPAGSVNHVYLPDGVEQAIAYDSEKRVAALTDGAGKTTRYEYGGFDLLVGLTRPDGQRLQFGYDKLTRFNQVTNALGETYRYSHDLAGQIVAETDFTGRTLHYQYDAVGRRIWARYPDGRLIRWHYSIRDQVVEQQTWRCDELSSSLVARVSYDYDDSGRLLKAENAAAVVEFDYDDTGQLIAERLNGREIQHQWDALTGTPSARRVGERGLEFVYGSLGELTQLQLIGHQPLRLQHDKLGRETVRESAAGFIQASNYTPTGLLANQAAGRNSALFQQQLAAPEGAATPALYGSAVNRRWQYDRAYNVVGIDDSRWGKTRYQYDLNDQIVRADFGGFLPLQEQFSYDANHNLTWQTRLPRGATAVLEQDAQHQLAGRVISRGNNQYHYDNAGRLSEKRELKDGFRPQVWRYRWDEQDQLSELMTPFGERWRYGYDAFGRRIRKLRLVSNAPAVSTQGDEPTASEKSGQVGYEYLWSGDQLIEEVPIYADGTAAYEQSIHWLYAPGALTPAARYENGKLHYVVADHLGTPRELLNEQGKVVWANRLSTWGRAELWRQAANDEDNVTCNLRFAGQYADAESGLYYNRFRYYDGETGQYLCPDPIGLLGGNNPYGYVHNPLGWVDPLGLAGTDASGRPLSSPNYSVWHQAEIPVDIQSGTRAQHFRNANQQLYEAIQRNPDLGQSLPPEVVAHVQPKPRGGFSDKSPPSQTWHHNAQDPTKIELVPRPQHKALGPVQASLHPNQGGGFKALRSKCC